MRVVCDTNVLVSAFVFPGGSPERVIERARLGEYELCLSPEILDEFRTVLIKKFRYSAIEASEYLDRITSVAIMVYPTERLHRITRKDSDNRILECAVKAEADFLVTGDKRDILPLKKIGKTQILSPSVFLLKMADQV